MLNDFRRRYADVLQKWPALVAGLIFLLSLPSSRVGEIGGIAVFSIFIFALLSTLNWILKKINVADPVQKRQNQQLVGNRAFTTGIIMLSVSGLNIGTCGLPGYIIGGVVNSRSAEKSWETFLMLSFIGVVLGLILIIAGSILQNLGKRPPA